MPDSAVARSLNRAGLDLTRVESLEQARARLLDAGSHDGPAVGALQSASFTYDALVLECAAGDAAALALLKALRRRGSQLPVVAVTHDDTDEAVRRALQAGADDHLASEDASRGGLLARVIRNAIERRQLTVERSRADAAVLDINRRLRLALAEVSEREQTIRRQAEHLTALNQQLEEALAGLRAAQEQVVQQERLRALGQMASGVAHDLNNALAPVLGFAELLLVRPEVRQDWAQTQHYLQMIHTGAQDAAAVVARLREFYRPGVDTGDFQPVDVLQLFERCAALTQPRWRDQALAEGRTIRLRTWIDPAAKELYVQGSEPALREALTNLVFNAVDALPRGGEIVLRARLAGQRIALEVVDSGTGMTDDVRRQALDPFFTTKGERGSGLGLAMVYGVVIRHQGQMEIESLPGAGTTVRLLIPVASSRGVRQGKDAATECATQSAEGGRSLRVLVVDDEVAVRRLTVAFLKQQGHVVLEATSGEEALRVASRDVPDVVLTDRAMAGMSGDQLAAAVKTRLPGVPVVMLTGFGDLMVASGEQPPGVDLVVGKPLTLSSLRDALSAVLPPAA